MRTAKLSSQCSSNVAILLFVLAACPVAGMAQWLNYPTPGTPRLANGAPDLKAPAPRTPDGKPDFSGIVVRKRSLEGYLP